MQQSNRVGRVITLMAAAAVVGLGWTAVRGQAGGGEPTAVAVVDISRVFQSLKVQTTFEADRNARRLRLQEQAQEKQATAQAMQGDLEMLTPGTPAHDAKLSDLERAAIDLQVWTQYEQRRMNRETMAQVEKVYRDVRDATARIAQDAGYDVVLLDQPDPELNAENFQQMLAQIADRKVLYAGERVDLTDTVIRRMNNEYDAAR
jgi:Skp family chaperone for outer membrane proteins